MPAKVNSSSGQKMPPKLRLKLANECENLLTKAEIKPLNKKFKFHVLHSKQVNEATFEKLMTLFKSLMQSMYKQSNWGWNEQEKTAEFKHPKTKVIIVTKDDGCDPTKVISFGELPREDDEIVGFMNFRFDVGSDKSESALYVWELHISIEYQRQGLGEELMRMARVFGTAFKMDKIMLTVFRCNQPALQFYQKLKFNTDKSSPAPNEADYIILNSKIKF